MRDKERLSHAMASLKLIRDEHRCVCGVLTDQACPRCLAEATLEELGVPPQPGEKLQLMEERFVCRDHGYGVKTDEDGGCAMCGRDCVIVAIVHDPDGCECGGESESTTSATA